MANPLYFIECDYGRLGRAFCEVDRDTNSRAQIVGLIRSGEVDPVKVLEVCEDDCSVRDITAEIVAEATQEREPASWQEIGDKLATLQDHARDLRKHEAV